MFTLVGLYADWTFSSCDLVTSGASAPQPSASSLALGAGALERPRGLNPEPPPPTDVGVKTGFLDATGGGPLEEGMLGPPEYFAPEASATFWMILSGVRSASERAVTWTW
jgi:hypothetical protein